MMQYSVINITILNQIRAIYPIFADTNKFPDADLWRMFVDIYNESIVSLGYGCDGILSMVRREKFPIDTASCYVSMDIALKFKPLNEILIAKLVKVLSNGMISEELIINPNQYVYDGVFHFRKDLSCIDRCEKLLLVIEYSGGYQSIPECLLELFATLMEEALCLPANCSSDACSKIEKLGKNAYLVSLKKGDYEWRWNNMKDDVQDLIRTNRAGKFKKIFAEYSINYLSYKPFVYKASWGLK